MGDNHIKSAIDHIKNLGNQIKTTSHHIKMALHHIICIIIPINGRSTNKKRSEAHSPSLRFYYFCNVFLIYLMVFLKSSAVGRPNGPV